MYQPKKGFLLQKQVKRITPKSSFLKKLERDQADKPAEDAAKRVQQMIADGTIAATPAVVRKLQLVEGYKARRK